MIKTKEVILLFLIIISYNIIAQEKIYTQKEIDTFKILPTNRENILTYRKMLESDKNLLGWTYYYSKMSVLHLGENKLDSCYFYANKAIESYALSDQKRAKDEKQLTRAYYNGGRALRLYYKNYNKSLDYMMNSLALITKYPRFSKYLRGYILKDIANIHLQMGDDRMALKYLLKTSKDTNYLKNPLNYSPLYNGIGEMFLEQKKPDSAIYFYHKALLDTIKSRRVTAHNNLGDLYIKQDKIDSVLYHYDISKKLADLYDNKVSITSKYNSKVNYSYILNHQKKYKESIDNLKSVLDSINAFGKFNKVDKDLKIKAMDRLIETYKIYNQPENALVVSLNKSQFLEQFYQQVLDEKLRDLTIAYEVREKDKSIQQLELTNKEQNIILRQRNIITAVLGILLLSILGMGFLFFRQRKLKNKYETANLEQRLLRSQLNPHFVFNALNTVSILAGKNSENTIPYIAKLASLIRLILKNSREEFVLLEDELKSIEDYLELQSNFSQKFNYKINIDNSIDQEITCIPPMFIQPFIENAIEHGLKGIENGIISIDIAINTTDKLINCRILDNGIGISKASKFVSDPIQKHGSFSGKILKERLHIYSKSLNKKAKYTIKDVSNGSGTEVNILLPYVLE
ncbi:histidine kinase [Aquimarina sp. 2201CG5-10]|uniref:tetratricopeptide repeat-containing sensor histidine kinase n=1 Tax=Aquimarina callyspongiae TaxID=3098150 RepID=UPI002AB33478|nr:histidine kinase [Aquimarina sp. 2201CG5-10]MDY8136930.1 histidine kinase [Aquimarina sp. 2201CG5-10]